MTGKGNTDSVQHYSLVEDFIQLRWERDPGLNAAPCHQDLNILVKAQRFN